jgi:hypothetical protein
MQTVFCCQVVAGRMHEGNQAIMPPISLPLLIVDFPQ